MSNSEEFKALEEGYLNLLDKIIQNDPKYLVQMGASKGKGITPYAAYSAVPRYQLGPEDAIVIGEVIILGAQILNGDPVAAQKAGEIIAATNIIGGYFGKDPIATVAYKLLNHNFPDTDHSDTAKLISMVFNVGALNAGNVTKSIQIKSTPGAINGKVTVEKIEKLPKNVQKSYDEYKKNGWTNKSGATNGTKAGGRHDNDNKLLPAKDVKGNPITYKEYDVSNKIAGQGRDSERFVTGSDGSIYFTNIHYRGFIKIK